MRTLARILTALAAVEGLLCLYVLAFGGVRFDTGPVVISAGTWRRPLAQGIALALVASVLYWRDAVRHGEWDIVPRVMRRVASRLVSAIRDFTRQAASNIGTEPLLWTGIVLAAIAASIVSYRVATLTFVLGSAEEGWGYLYIRDVSWRIATIVVIVGMSTGAALRWLTAPRNARKEWAMAIAWIALATGCQVLLRSLTPFGFGEIFLSDGANSFYTVTQQFDAASVLNRFAELRVEWPMHAHSNMPGKLMLLYALERVSNDPTVLSWLLLTISNLGGLLLYLLIRDLFRDRQIAIYALVLYLFVPAKLFFFPLMNTVTPVVAFACLLMFERWLQRASLAYGSAAAVSLYGLVFFEPVPLVVGALVAMILSRALVRREIAMTTLIKQGALLIATFFGVFALVWLLFDFNLADAFRRVVADAAAFNASANRQYGHWVWRNLVEFGFGTGICQVVLFWFAAADGLGSKAGSFLERPIAFYSIAVLVMLLVLDLAGVNRGEVIRLWIFLACLFQVPAAYVCARLESRAAFAIVLILTIVQSALATATIGFVVP